MANDIPVGELLVRLCELSREHKVDIRFRQDPLIPNGFEIRLDRHDNHAVGGVDITRTFAYEPEDAAEYVFRRALYDIRQLEEMKNG
jgi:hypothetical protein